MAAKEPKANISKYTSKRPKDLDALYDWDKDLSRQMRNARWLAEAYDERSTLEDIVDHLQAEIVRSTKTRCELRSQQGWKIVLSIGPRITTMFQWQSEHEIQFHTLHDIAITIPNDNIRGYTERHGVFTLKARM